MRPDDLPSGLVVRVVDGDTVDVRLDEQTERVRVIGIDTPEPTDLDSDVRCRADVATDRARELLDGKMVWLEEDPSQDNRDQFGRLLRYLWLPDGRMFNHVMVAEGLAREYTFRARYKYQAPFRQAEQNARSLGRGGWSPRQCLEFAEPPTAAGPSVVTPVPTEPGATSGPGPAFIAVVGGPPRSTARVVVEARPGANCAISYRTPAGTVSVAQGLTPKTTDNEGQVAWSWNIGSSTRPGVGRVTVTCGESSISSPITIG